MRDPKRSAGFTLIEILIVIGMLGIMGAIAIPLMANHISTQQERVIAADAMAVRAAAQAYYANFQNTAPPTMDDLLDNYNLILEGPTADVTLNPGGGAPEELTITVTRTIRGTVKQFQADLVSENGNWLAR